MPLLQRYIFGELLRVFLFVLFCLTVLVNFIGVFQTATERGLGAEQVWQVLPYIIPSMLPFTIPAALLLTVCLVYGRMAGDQEVTAAKAAGISVVTMLWPSIAFAGALSAASLVLTDQVIPWAMATIEQKLVQTMEDVFLERLRTEHHFSDRARGYEITVVDVRDRTLIRPVIRQVRKNGHSYTLMADEATIELDVPNQRAELHIKGGFIDLQRGGPRGVTESLTVREHREVFSLANELGKPKPRNLPIAVIESQIHEALEEEEEARERRLVDAAMSLTMGQFQRLPKLSQWKADEAGTHSSVYHRLHTEIHSRYAMSCSCVFFALLGGPFAIYKAKSQFLTAFMYCFVPIVAVYYPLILGMMTQAKRGHVDPRWAMWSGNAVLLAAAWLVLRRVIRH
ncbi:MAG: LptF/LptG family permease [Planctomyces sp.]|nr:LptF/LptG family permease [Planctomyces sp.]